MIYFNYIILILILLILIIYIVFRLLKCTGTVDKIHQKIKVFTDTRKDLKDKIKEWDQKNAICQQLKEPFVCMASIGTGPAHRDAFESDTANLARSCDMSCPGNADNDNPYNKYDPNISFIRGVGQCCTSIGKSSLPTPPPLGESGEYSESTQKPHDPTDHLINQPGNGNQNNNNGSIEFGPNGCIDLPPVAFDKFNTNNASGHPKDKGNCIYDNGSGPNINIGNIQQKCMTPKSPVINQETSNITKCPVCPTYTPLPIPQPEEENILNTIPPTINEEESTSNSQFIKLTKGEPGTNSACLPTGCIFDTKYCINKYGQCGILENEVEQKCGQWSLCKGVVCRSDYNGYCLARGEMGTKTSPSMWGYKKI